LKERRICAYRRRGVVVVRPILHAIATLPHLSGETFITDGGMETTLLYHHGMELPEFASFPLLESDEGRAALRAYFEPYLAIARERGVGILLDAPTWRANPDWGAKLGYSLEELEDANRRAVAFMDELRDQADVLVSGCVGPRGDGYVPGELMTAAEAEDYHGWQVGIFADTDVDLVSALTMNYVEEALGVAKAAANAALPCVVSFTVETDGRLPSGQPLPEAVEQVDEETSAAPAYFMINCAHPTHFAEVVEEDGAWKQRIRGLRANASKMSHAELDEAEELDAGDPAELAERHRALHPKLPNVNVVGGCCGTDHRHIAAIADAWLEAA
jgi:S-methylmethionine-dependent homocysteine/selenocysteine methylase